MAQAGDKLGIVYQNLIDAGCNRQITEQCMSFIREGKDSAMLPILSQYRSALLGTVRAGQKQLDCLDFLIYNVSRGNAEDL